ncbi:hypothetical protein HID58_028856 [Brassica napus]|uniref:Uncharacterized protein n=1 Tax=Brassica napus TaxID=3708 RepID=A0ABQ8CDD5_BRANA|nr:hypothetical protein HID58_028856 [Brassica napus]
MTISHTSFFLRVVDLTILGLLFSLLLYRILHMRENDNVWLVAFLCESGFTFIWLIITCIKWSPAEDKPYPNRLDERRIALHANIEEAFKLHHATTTLDLRGDLQGDTSADLPTIQESHELAATALRSAKRRRRRTGPGPSPRLLPGLPILNFRICDLPSVDMFVPTANPVREPPIIVANTVLSLLALNYPANKLACYVSDDGCSPLTYFSLKETSKFAKIWVPFCKKYNVRVRAPFRYFLNPLVAAYDSEFRKDWKMTKREYEKLRRKVEDSTGDSFLLDGDDELETFSNAKPNNHSTIVKVVWENKGGVGDEKEVPHLVYISREKRPDYVHHYKSGAMNFLLRVSGLMTNAPYMLNVDCDMYANEADVVRQAMCVFLQKSKSPDRCAFVQFPQEFYDSNSDELAVVQSYLGRGVAGIQGPLYCGSGCFHTRRVMYGLSPDNLENNGDLSSSATIEFLDEDSLARKFGSSKELVISIVEALQGKSNPKTSLTDFIEAAQMVGHCHYEHQTNWGKTLGCLYDSVAEDMNTSIGIHLRGWSSSYICPDPPAFLGSTPSVGFEAIVQQRRWGTGAIEVLFNKQSPLRGMFSSKIRFRQRLAYLWVLMCLRSIPELFYCLLPAYCLLRNTALYPKGPCLAITVTIVAMHCLYTLWQFTNNGFSVRSWYVSQSLWRILATCGWLFSIHDILLKLLGISNVGFVVAKKTTPKTMPISGYEPIQRQDDGPNSCYRSSCHHEGGRSGLAENCACILVILLFLPFLKGLFAKGKYGIPLSTLSKAALLAMIFVVFAVGY